MSWTETTSGNRISNESRLLGQEKIHIKGNTTIESGVTINGDVENLQGTQAITMGKYCYISSNCTITPPRLKIIDNQPYYGQLQMGSYVIIEPNCQVNSAAIGNRVIIEADCIIDDLSVVYDCCIIRRGTTIPAKMIIPPFSEVRGIPGKDFKVSSLGVGYKKSIELEAKQLQIIGRR